MNAEEQDKSVSLQNGTKVEEESTPKISSPGSKSAPKQPNFFNAPERVPFPAPIKGDILCEDFFKASEDYVKFFEPFGSVLRLLTQDILKNVRSARAVYEKNKASNKTLRELLANEKARGETQAITGILWLTRGLQFYIEVLQDLYNNILKPAVERVDTDVLAPGAHQNTLAKHQGYLSLNLCKLALRTMPKRGDITRLLCYVEEGPDEFTLFSEAMNNIRHVPAVISAIDAVYEQLEIDTSMYRAP